MASKLRTKRTLKETGDDDGMDDSAPDAPADPVEALAKAAKNAEAAAAKASDAAAGRIKKPAGRVPLPGEIGAEGEGEVPAAKKPRVEGEPGMEKSVEGDQVGGQKVGEETAAGTESEGEGEATGVGGVAKVKPTIPKKKPVPIARVVAPHMVSVASAKKSDEPAVPTPCAACQTVFPSAALLANHSKTDACNGPHICKECSKDFRKESFLRRCLPFPINIKMLLLDLRHQALRAIAVASAPAAVWVRGGGTWALSCARTHTECALPVSHFNRGTSG